MVREELIRQIQTPKEKEISEFSKNFENFWNNFLGDEYQERKKGEVIVNGKEDVNTPLYRNGAGYKTELHDGKIKKLTVHYYLGF